MEYLYGEYFINSCYHMKDFGSKNMVYHYFASSHCEIACDDVDVVNKSGFAQNKNYDNKKMSIISFNYSILELYLPEIIIIDNLYMRTQ